MTSDLVLSASSINVYLRCPHRYLLGYVYRLGGGQQSMAAVIGHAVHAGIETLWRSHPVRPQEALRAAFMGEVDLVPATEREADPDALQDALREYETYEREMLPRFRPTLVEAPFATRVEGVILTGTIDAADDNVHDTKTTRGKTIAGRKPSRFDPARHDVQLSLYRIGYRALTGRWPGRLILDVLTRRGTYREYVREPQMADALDALRVVRDGITRGEFDPTGALTGACSYCPFRSVCTYATVA